MPKHAYTKTLKKAVPTLRTADGIVKSWELEVLCTSVENGWRTTYNEREGVEYLGKLPTEFTKSELLSFVNVNDAVFDAHWEAHNTEPTEERSDSFDFTSLPE